MRLVQSVQGEQGLALHPFLVLIRKATESPKAQDEETTQAVHEAVDYILTYLVVESAEKDLHLGSEAAQEA